MTLSEAFCDDIAALQAGVFTLLPARDLSGRHLVYIEGTRLSDVEYDPDSMVSGLLSIDSLTCERIESDVLKYY